MRNLVFTGLGIGFLFMGVGLYALSLRKPGKSDKSAKPVVNPNKSQLREQAVLAEETKKMRIGAGCIAGLGLALIVFSFI